MTHRLFFLALPVLALGSHANAQTIRGTLSDSASRAPVPGAVVVLVGEGNFVAARAMSDERGTFLLHTPAAGTFRIRTLRIGFQPVITGRFDLVADRDTTMALRLASIPYSLREVQVSGRGECRVRPDSGAEIARVWELARTALTATALSEQQRVIRALMTKWVRIYDVRGWRLRSDSIYEVENFSTRGFRAVSTDKLAEGWVQSEPDGSSFFAPDAELLLSDFFSASHCIYLKDGDARFGDDPLAELDQPRSVARIPTAGRIGLVFEPTDNRGSRVDIAGTLWLDRVTSELVGLEFSYTSLPNAMTSAGAGGRVDFRHLPNGSWIVSQWLIRMPVLKRSNQARDTVDRVMTTGGAVLAATRGGDTLWTVPRVTLRGVVLDSMSRAPVSGARLTLVGTGRGVVTGADGRFIIAGLLPRMYLLSVRTPYADSLEVPPHESEIMIGRRGLELNVGVPSFEDNVRAGCDSLSTERPGVIAGVLRSVSGVPVANARVTVRWFRVTSMLAEFIGSATESQQTITNAFGGFRVCALPRNRELTFTVGENPSPGTGVKARIPDRVTYLRKDLVTP